MRPGSDAEDQAANYLIGKGYSLVTRRYKATRGEIDLIALDGDTLVFVEVKQRRLGYTPEESIGDRKIARLVAASGEYLRTMDMLEHPVRYDVIAIDPSGLRHHEDAFRP